MNAGVFFAILSAVSWAVAGSIFKKGLLSTDTFNGNFVRSLFASIFFAPILLLESPYEVFSMDFITLAILILSTLFSFFVGDLLYFASLKRTAVSIALPLASTYPVYVVLLTTVIYSIPFNPFTLLAAIMTVLAVYVIPKDGSGGTSGFHLALLAAMSWAISIIMLDFLTARLSVITVATLRMALNAAILAAIVAPKLNLDRNAIIYAGLFGGAISVIGIFSFVQAVSMIGSWRTSPIVATSPVIGAAISKVWLGERIDKKTMLAIALVFLSVLLSSMPSETV
jgi:DME family drug/metabolite transporter